MFHNFLRIVRSPHILRSSYCMTQGNKSIVLSNAGRFYCKDASDKGSESSKSDPSKKSKKEKVNICVTTRKNPYDVCDPGRKRPCIPSPPPYNIGPRRCPDPCKMDSLPKPECPWDPEYEEANKKYMKHLLLGVLFSAITMLVLFWNMNFTKPKKEAGEDKYKRPKPTCKIPPKEEDIPKDVPYLLIGGGTASFSAFRAIKSTDPTAKVLVVSNECYFPYMRPPLSKEMWFNNDDKNVNKLFFKQWNGTERSLFYEPKDFYIKSKDLMSNPNGGVSVIQGYKVNKIDVVKRIAYLESGRPIKYGNCLIATGGTPKNLPVFERAKPELQNKVTLYRDIFDFQELHDICKEAKSVAIIGGGFLGSELACALGKIAQKQGTKVYQIFKEKGNMGKILPEYLSEWTTNKIKQEKVNIINKTEVEDAVLDEKGRVMLHLNNGKKIVADHVIVAIGIQPNTELAQTSDLEVDPDLNGFLVNAEMEARSHLYVAGDCSCFYDVKLGRRRVEHHDHAVVSGRLAGENMAGATKPYIHQSMFWSDLGPNIGYEAIGLVDSTLPTVAVFANATEKDTPQAVVASTDNNLRSATEEAAGKLNEAAIGATESEEEDESPTVKQLSTPVKTPVPLARKSHRPDDYGKGVIFYLRNDVVVGIVLWNVFNRMSIARQVLKDERQYEDLNEVAKLFNIHDE